MTTEKSRGVEIARKTIRIGASPVIINSHHGTRIVTMYKAVVTVKIATTITATNVRTVMSTYSTAIPASVTEVVVGVVVMSTIIVASQHLSS